MVHVHDGEFVRVRVPAYLERSLQIALGGVHAPFFTDHEGAALAVVLRRDEWDRLAPRFTAAEVSGGFRLLSLKRGPDPWLPSSLRQALGERGVAACVLPSFHNDHLLVRDDHVQRCLEVIREILPASVR